MPVFAYEAIDAAARPMTGVVEAQTAGAARRLLRGRGLRPCRLHDRRTAQPRASLVAHAAAYLHSFRQRERVTEAIENLITLLESGVTLESAWSDLASSTTQHARLSALLHSLHDATATGQALSEAMTAHPLHFDTVDVAIVRAGEDAGDLPPALSRVLARRRLAGKLASTFFAALAYPAFLMVFGCGVVMFLAMYVIPDINAMLVAGGGSVPRMTSLLQAFAWFLGYGLLPVLIFLALAAVIVLRKHPSMRQRAYVMALRTPVAGHCWLNWQLSQLCLVLRTLLASGVQLPAALSLAAQACGEGPVRESTLALRHRVLDGHDLGQPPGDGATGLPPWLWRALAVGQRSGELVNVLQRVGESFETAALRSATRMGAILEPLMIMIVGLFIGVVAYAGLLPIIRLNTLW